MKCTESTVEALIDRQAILDCLSAYCRGVDRLDIELLRSAYHPDARENHNGVVIGTIDDLVDWVQGPYQQQLISSHHTIQNHSCELDGATAHTETYCIYTEIRGGPPKLRQMGGRYIDRFECRNGRWAIAARTLVMDWSADFPDVAPVFPTPEASTRAGQAFAYRDTRDPSYLRPMTV